ncbi:MAG: phosphoglycerate dehydrogenase, partial [Desulfuromonadales bacterium]
MKVIVTDEVSESGLQLLQNDPRFEVDVRLGLPVEELRRLIADYDAIITRSGTQVDRALLENAGRLRLIARAG